MNLNTPLLQSLARVVTRVRKLHLKLSFMDSLSIGRCHIKLSMVRLQGMVNKNEPKFNPEYL